MNQASTGRASAPFPRRRLIESGCVTSFRCERCGDTDCEPATVYVAKVPAALARQTRARYGRLFRLRVAQSWCIGCAVEAGYDVRDYSGYVYRSERAA